MEVQLNGMKVAFVVADGFEQVELAEPRQALDGAGAATAILSPAERWVKGWDRRHWGSEFPVDIPLPEGNPADYEALVLPGGVMSPDHLRRNEDALRFVKHFFTTKGRETPANATTPLLRGETWGINGRMVSSLSRPSRQNELHPGSELRQQSLDLPAPSWSRQFQIFWNRRGPQGTNITSTRNWAV